MAKNQLTFAERILLKEVLDTFIVKREDGRPTYKVGVSDKTVAAAFGHNANRRHVAYVRNQCYPDFVLPSPIGGSHPGFNNARLNKIESALLFLARELGLTPSQLSRMGYPPDEDGFPEG